MKCKWEIRQSQKQFRKASESIQQFLWAQGTETMLPATIQLFCTIMVRIYLCHTFLVGFYSHHISMVRFQLYFCCFLTIFFIFQLFCPVLVRIYYISAIFLKFALSCNYSAQLWYDSFSIKFLMQFSINYSYQQFNSIF